MRYANWNAIEAHVELIGVHPDAAAAFDLFVARRFRGECARHMEEHRQGDRYWFSQDFIVTNHVAGGDSRMYTSFETLEARFLFSLGDDLPSAWDVETHPMLNGITFGFPGEPMIPRMVVNKARRHLNYIRDCAASLDAREIAKLPRMSFAAAHAKATEWHQRIARRAEEEREESNRRMHRAVDAVYTRANVLRDQQYGRMIGMTDDEFSRT